MKLWRADEKCVISYLGFTAAAVNTAEELGVITYNFSQMDQLKRRFSPLLYALNLVGTQH